MAEEPSNAAPSEKAANAVKPAGVDWGGVAIVVAVIAMVAIGYGFFLGQESKPKTSEELVAEAREEAKVAQANLERELATNPIAIQAQMEADRRAKQGALNDQLKLKIEKYYRDGDYDYVEGTVTNKGSSNFGYWKATVEFTDKQGQVIDTAYTNDLNTLRPGATKRWRVMHERVGAASVSAFITDSTPE